MTPLHNLGNKARLHHVPLTKGHHKVQDIAVKP